LDEVSLSFEGLKLIEPLLRAVRAEGYERPTPIQQKAIPYVLAGRDVLGCAQTGTGKTAAFALPILQLLHDAPKHQHEHRLIRALVLSPTRELAAQIADSFGSYGRHTGLRHAVVYGGVGQGPQVDSLRRGVDILVATPGRLLDLMGQGQVKLHGLRILVLDEADRMLDMGFIPDVRRIVGALPSRRQTLFFSATLTPDILRVAGTMVLDPVRVEVAPAATTVESVRQFVYFVERNDKRALLSHVLKDPFLDRVLVFTRTKHGADSVAQHLHHAGIKVHVIHGNKTQGARKQALDGFRGGHVRVLVATDIAARGLDIEAVSHVINFDLPDDPEAYVHRIGRTARAEASGIAVAFCNWEERETLTAIERLIRMKIEVIEDHPYKSRIGAPLPPESRPEPMRRPPRPRFSRRRNLKSRW
jgi:ATP-dependent RNA helicase RhlE